MPTPLPQNQLVAPSGTGAGLYTQGAMEQQQKYPGLNQDVAIGNAMMNETGFIPSVITSKTAADKTATNQATLEKIKIMQQQAIDSAAKQHKEAGTTPVADKTATTTDGTTKTPDPLQAQLDAANAQLEANSKSLADSIDAFKTNLDTQNQLAIENIKNMYARRKEQMATINTESLNAQTIIGIRAGRQRYAPEIQTSILSNEERAGIQRLTDLDNEESQLIAEANAANSAKQFELLDKKMSALNAVQENKIKTIQEQQKMGIAQDQLLLQKAQDAREAAKSAREEQEATITNLANTIAGSLIGLDTKASAQQIKSSAEAYGVDPNFLQSAIIDVQNSQKKEQLALSKINLDIAQNLPKGETWTDPATGLKFTGIDEEMIDIERIVGNEKFKVRYDISGKTPKEVFSLSEGQAYKPTAAGLGGGGGMPKAFWTAVSSGVASLKKGEDWGTVWNRVHTQFPDVSSEVLDNALGTTWREQGAYQNFQKSGIDPEKQKTDMIWRELANPENAQLDDETKKIWVQSQGVDPSKFGLY